MCLLYQRQIATPCHPHDDWDGPRCQDHGSSTKAATGKSHGQKPILAKTVPLVLMSFKELGHIVSHYPVSEGTDMKRFSPSRWRGVVFVCAMVPALAIAVPETINSGGEEGTAGHITVLSSIGQAVQGPGHESVSNWDLNAGFCYLIGNFFTTVWYADEPFSTDVMNPTPGGTTGWVPFSSYQTGQTTDYDAVNQALRVTISTGTVPRINGWLSANSEWMPYAVVGTDNCARGKFFMFRANQPDMSDLNQVPNMRMRLATRFAMVSILEVFNHLAGDVTGTNAGRELCPSADPTSPSIYRVDFDPVDVPALNTAGEGISRGYEAYSLEPQEVGSIEMTESMIGTYPVAACPDAGPEVLAEKVFTVSASDAGDLRVFNSLTDGAFLRKFVLLSPGNLGSEIALDGATDPTCTESSAGVTLDTTLVATNRVGLASREFTEVGANSERIRAERDWQYKIRWHVTASTNANRNPQLRLRARAIKFMWSQKQETGGALAAGNLNNTIAQQALPGVGTQNPDQLVPGENGGWYTLWLHTPLSHEIRDSQPVIAAQPGSGSGSNSIRDIKFGVDVLDTLSGMVSSTQEKGTFTLDRIELRAYNLVDD